jgi:hypothetical protein
VAKATALFAARPTGAGDPTLRGIAGIGNLIRGEAYVLGYIDGFWIIAWVLTAGIVLLLLLRSPLPNPMRYGRPGLVGSTPQDRSPHRNFGLSISSPFAFSGSAQGLLAIVRHWSPPHQTTREYDTADNQCGPN